MKRLLILLALCAVASPGSAATQYITDQFKVMLRTGPTTGHKIIGALRTGESVKTLKIDADAGYTKVRTSTGKVGFVLSRQLQPQPVARVRLQAANARIKELTEAPESLARQLTELRTAHAELQRAHTELGGIKDQLQQELLVLQRTSSNAVRVTKERDALRKQVADLTRRSAELEQENRELGNDSVQTWFMVGGAVLAGGVILGLILPNLRVRRPRDSWGSL